MTVPLEIADLVSRFGYFAVFAGTVLGVRFMYGLRTAGPAVIGASGLSTALFVPVNLAGALLWSACWAGAGYVLGETAERVLGQVERFERGVALGVIVFGVVVAVVTLLRRRGDGR